MTWLEASPPGDGGEWAADLYISADVETDGPIPGPYSMLSFALVVVGSFDGRVLTRTPGREYFYRELKPISNDYQPEAMAINGLDRDKLLSLGSSPAEVMTEASEWVVKQAVGFRPVLIGYPVVFDWTFLYWYFTRFSATGSPFGFSGCLDIKTMLATKRRVPLTLASKQFVPERLKPQAPHTHHALDDAIEQGELFIKIFDWEGSD